MYHFKLYVIQIWSICKNAQNITIVWMNQDLGIGIIDFSSSVYGLWYVLTTIMRYSYFWYFIWLIRLVCQIEYFHNRKIVKFTEKSRFDSHFRIHILLGFMDVPWIIGWILYQIFKKSPFYKNMKLEYYNQLIFNSSI